MSYTKLGFESGQVLEAEQLNHMESGIEDADITGADGVIKQEHLPEGYPYKTLGEGYILPTAIPVYSEDKGAFLITESSHFVEVGKEYTVKWNGTEYNCVVKIITSAPEEFAQFIGLPAMGNFAFIGGENTGEPFAILCVPENYVNILGFAYGVIPLDGSTQIMLSIKGETTIYKEINPNYLPSNIVTALTDGNNNIIQCDKNYSEILELVNSGRDVILRMQMGSGSFAIVTMARFASIYNGVIGFIGIRNSAVSLEVEVNPDNTWVTEQF